LIKTHFLNRRFLSSGDRLSLHGTSLELRLVLVDGVALLDVHERVTPPKSRYGDQPPNVVPLFKVERQKLQRDGA